MTMIPLHNIFERIFQLKGMTSKNEVDQISLRLKYDRKFAEEFDDYKN